MDFPSGAHSGWPCRLSIVLPSSLSMAVKKEATLAWKGSQLYGYAMALVGGGRRWLRRSRPAFSRLVGQGFAGVAIGPTFDAEDDGSFHQAIEKSHGEGAVG